MATYIALIDFTTTGVSEFKETTGRAQRFKAFAKKSGAKVKEIYWTLGNHDGVLLFEAKGDEQATRLMLELSSEGSVKTTTLRAFTASEMQAIIEKT
jgi:uncharacterized protein with GYD domain